jgi:hypothetical protein
VHSQEREELVDAVIVNLVPVLFEDVEEIFEPLDFMNITFEVFEDICHFLTQLLLIKRLISVPKH